MKFVPLCAISALLCSSTLFSQTVEKHTTPVPEHKKSEFEALMERVAALEKRVATLEKEKGNAPQQSQTDSQKVSDTEKIFTLGLAGYEQGDPYEKYNGARLIVDKQKSTNYVRGIYTYHECAKRNSDRKVGKWGKFDGTYDPTKEIELEIVFFPDFLSKAGFYIADSEGTKIECLVGSDYLEFNGTRTLSKKIDFKKEAINVLKIKISKGSARLIVNDKFVTATPLENKDTKFSKFGMFGLTSKNLVIKADVVSLKK